jgi:hypothetical protein
MGETRGTQAEVSIVADQDADVEELARLSRQLRDELLELDLDRVDYAAGQAPDGAKSGTAMSVGTLILTLSDSAVLAAAVGVLRAWVRRGSGRAVTVQVGKDKLEITGKLDEREADLISKFLDQHARQ